MHNEDARVKLTSYFLRNVQHLVPRRLLTVAEHGLVPLRQIEGRDHELRHVLGVREGHLVVARARDGRGLVGHVEPERERHHVRLDVRHAEVVEEPAVVDPGPFEVGLAQRREDGQPGFMLGQLFASARSCKAASALVLDMPVVWSPRHRGHGLKRKTYLSAGAKVPYSLAMKRLVGPDFAAAFTRLVSAASSSGPRTLSAEMTVCTLLLSRTLEIESTSL